MIRTTVATVTLMTALWAAGVAALALAPATPPEIAALRYHGAPIVNGLYQDPSGRFQVPLRVSLGGAT